MAFAPQPLFSDLVFTGTLPALNSTVILLLSNSSGAIVNVSGTWVGTIVFEGTNDGFITSQNAAVFTPPAGVISAGVTTNGYYRFVAVSGFTQIRARMSSYTSGTATIILSASIGAGLAPTVSVNYDSMLCTSKITGNSDGTRIGNTGDRLKVESTISDSAGSAITLGQKIMASSIPVVLASDESLPLFSDTSGTGTITALNGTVTANTSGIAGIVFDVTGTWTATITTEGTTDGTNWVTVLAADQSQAIFTIFSGSNTRVTINPSGYTKIRLRASAFTSGTVNVAWNASPVASPIFQVYQTNATSLKTQARAFDSVGNGITSQVNGSQRALDVGIDVAGIQVDPRQIRALTSADIVTSNIGTTNGLALDATLTGGTQKTKIVDSGGVNVATISATGAVKVDGSAITQPISAVSLPLPSGASTSALQTTANTSLASIDSKLTSPIAVTGPLTDAQLRATPVPVSGTVTANIGTTNGLALDATQTNRTAKSQITDGVRDGTIKAASTAALATDTSFVIALSPNSPLGAGSAIIGALVANQSVNLAQITGTATSVGAGTTSAGVQRVVLPTDQTGINTFLDKSGSGTITALNGTVSATTNGCSTIVFNITGTWVATITVQATTNGVDWVAINGIIEQGNGLQISPGYINTNNMLLVNCGGFSQVRLIATAFTSGTASIAWDAGSGVGNSQIVSPVNTYDTNILGGITALNGTASINSSGASNVIIRVTGVWVATLQLKATTADGVSHNIYGFNQTTGQLVTTITTASVLIVPCGGYANIFLTATAFTSGTANISLEASVGTNILTALSSPIDGFKATYSGSIIGLATATTATDIFTITGSATKTIRITKLEISATQTTAGVINVSLIKRSTANTAGTSATVTAIAHDSNNVAASATVLSYTANPTLGTSVGILRANKLFVSTALVAPSSTEHDFGIRPGQCIVLRGITQVLSINLNSTTVTGSSFDIYIEWTEE